jgi:hypothetical protein
MHYKIALKQTPENNQMFAILGLESKPEHLSEGEQPSPDFYLWLVGLNEPCDTPESIIAGLHDTLYALLQCDDRLSDGDSFEFPGGLANKYLHYNNSLGVVSIPAVKFDCQGIHIIQTN